MRYLKNIKDWDLLKAGCFALLMFLLFTGHNLVAQEVKVNAHIDTNQALIGDQIRLKLTATYDKTEEIGWPLVGDTLSSDIEVVSIGTRDTIENGDIITCSQQLVITSFDSGYFVIPPFVFNVPGDSISEFETEPLLIKVTSPKVDTTQAIKDIKEPIGAPITLAEIWPYLVGGAALVAIIVFGFLYWKKRKGTPIATVFKKPETPPHEIAIAKLKALENKKLWQKDKVKDYHTELTDIIREYIEKRYGIIAMELTSVEIIESFSGLGIASPSSDMLRQVLGLADMVKFAKAKPLANEHTLSMNNAYEFVLAGVAVVEKEDTEEQALDIDMKTI